MLRRYHWVKDYYTRYIHTWYNGDTLEELVFKLCSEFIAVFHICIHCFRIVC